jgi:hypothetical protein
MATAAVLRREFLANALEAVDLLHDQLDRLQHQPARLGQATDAFAVSCENINTKLFLQLDNCFGHARLRREERFGGVGQVVILADGFAHEAQLVKIH